MKYLEKRAEMIRAIRNFFYSKDYLEVETPIRIPTPIPEEHIAPFESEGWYLQSSPEICMKRLASHGYGKIFQICKCFRKDERGDRHLTELTMLEWYSKDYSYMELMDECKEMIGYVAGELLIPVRNMAQPDATEAGLYIDYGNYRISMNNQWQQITVSEAFERYGSMTMEEAEKTGCFDEIMAFEIEPCLGLKVPTFIYDYPASMASLAKLKPNESNLHKNDLAERFELYIAGIELANGFSELTDPVEQRERLLNTVRKRKEKVMPIPEFFIKDLAKLPKTAGIALGVDRLAMIFTNSPAIDDVVAFTPEEL